jgi:uncharacterized membrane protein YraQ (UPF0718 family)
MAAKQHGVVLTTSDHEVAQHKMEQYVVIVQLTESGVTIATNLATLMAGMCCIIPAFLISQSLSTLRKMAFK